MTTTESTESTESTYRVTRVTTESTDQERVFALARKLKGDYQYGSNIALAVARNQCRELPDYTEDAYPTKDRDTYFTLVRRYTLTNPVEGFNIIIDVRHDPDMVGYEFYGSFSKDWDERAIPAQRGVDYRDLSYSRFESELPWFILDNGNSISERVGWLNGKGYGYAKQPARELATEHANQDLARANAIAENGGTYGVIVLVTASLDGEELGTDVLWGFEPETMDYPRDWEVFDFIEGNDLIGEAIANARENVPRVIARMTSHLARLAEVEEGV